MLNLIKKNAWRAVGALLTGLASTAHADGLSDLETFLRTTQQGKTSFTQTVTAPPKQGETVSRTKTSSGTFEFLRPNRFRFQYTKPFEQIIAADGQTLWLYDADLSQATARRQQDVLGNTPAALIAAAPDLRGLNSVFNLGNAPEANGQTWVVATPKSKDGQLQSLRLGFRQGQLSTLEILDSFGQRSVMSFGALDTQTSFKPGHFQFQPPPGTDVIRQ